MSTLNEIHAAVSVTGIVLLVMISVLGYMVIDYYQKLRRQLDRIEKKLDAGGRKDAK